MWYEDFRTVTKLYLAADEIGVTERCYYHYYQRPDSTMHNSNLQRNLEILDAMEDILSYYQEQGAFEHFREELEFLAIYRLLLRKRYRIISLLFKIKG